METLQDATVKICDLKGNILAIESLICALLRVLPANALAPLTLEFEQESGALKTSLLNASISEHTISAVERDVQRLSAILRTRLGE